MRVSDLIFALREVWLSSTAGDPEVVFRLEQTKMKPIVRVGKTLVLVGDRMCIEIDSQRPRRKPTSNKATKGK